MYGLFNRRSPANRLGGMSGLGGMGPAPAGASPMAQLQASRPHRASTEVLGTMPFDSTNTTTESDILGGGGRAQRMPFAQSMGLLSQQFGPQQGLGLLGGGLLGQPQAGGFYPMQQQRGVFGAPMQQGPGMGIPAAGMAQNGSPMGGFGRQSTMGNSAAGVAQFNSQPWRNLVGWG